MIITGYPCIGKSSIELGSTTVPVVDLDSGHFKNHKPVDPNWYKVYVDIARDLSRHGFIVFISSNRFVIGRMQELGLKFAMVFPSLDMEDEWVARATSRHDADPTPTNFRAMRRVVNNYKEDIKYLMSIPDVTYKRIINTTDYSLSAIVEALHFNWSHCLGIPKFVNKS